MTFESGSDGRELGHLREVRALGPLFMRGYGLLQLGLHQQTHDARPDFLLSSMNFFDENFVDVFVLES